MNADFMKPFQAAKEDNTTGQHPRNTLRFCPAEDLPQHREFGCGVGRITLTVLL